MDYIKRSDYLEVYKDTVISDVDFEVICNLYQPLIGYSASMLYFTLINYSKKYEGVKTTHSNIFTLMQIESNEFLTSRRKLEAIGLMKSYLVNDEEGKKYIYVLFSPKSPYEFFNDALFKGLLNIYIGEKEVNKLASLYERKFDVEKDKEISAQFMEVFNPDLDDSRFDIKTPNRLLKNRAIEISSNFTDEQFFEQLKVNMMNESSISKKEYEIIKSVAILYGLNVVTICDIVVEIYDKNAPKGKRINPDKLIERAMDESKFLLITNKNKENKTWVKISGKTKAANEIEIMQNPQTSPIKYLQLKQNGAEVIESDKNLINYLKFNLGLPNSVINAIIYYTLKTCNNRLNRKYVEKIASSIKRENLDNALDALNYLENPRVGKKYSPIINKSNERNIDKEDDNSSYDESEYDKVLEWFDDKK